MDTTAGKLVEMFVIAVIASTDVITVGNIAKKRY
jgi:hypothetical protein